MPRSLFLFAACSLAWGCGGSVTGGETTDASSGADGGGTTLGTSGSGNDSGRGEGADAATVGAYTGPCKISASSYDQSCSVDTDCMEITSTDYCSESCLCGGSAINVAAAPLFNDAVSKTPLGSGAVRGGDCPCAASLGPCCRAGMCSAMCLSTSDTLPACSNAGGSCNLSKYAVCTRPGPAGSCAFDDEICCLN
jgi:hypothetical protein